MSPRRDRSGWSASGDRSRRGPLGARWLVSLVLTVATVALGAGPVAADPAGPTDFQSEVVAVEPEVADLHLRVIGGDSFLELRAPAGTDVVVIGYYEEPYLRFDADGTVHENRRSPTTYLNEDRYADATPPSDAAAEAEPEWRLVATDGRYAWHDHRIHWMLPDPPPGLSAGDQVVDGTVPLEVDGEPVAVNVVSTWQEAPSVVPSVLGAVVAAAVVAGARVLGGRRSGPWVALGASVATAVVGGVAYWSVPRETGPSLVPLLLPLVAAALSVVALVVPRWREALVLAAAAELIIWAAVRRDGLTAAILPTDAPFWLDRSVTTGAAVVGVGLLALAVRDGALGPLRAGTADPGGTPRPATG